MFFKKHKQIKKCNHDDQDQDDLNRLVERAEIDSSYQADPEFIETWEPENQIDYAEFELERDNWDGLTTESFLESSPITMDETLPLTGKRAKYSAKMDKFLNSGIIIVGVLLVAVLLIAFLV